MTPVRVVPWLLLAASAAVQLSICFLTNLAAIFGYASAASKHAQIDHCFQQFPLHCMFHAAVSVSSFTTATVAVVTVFFLHVSAFVRRCNRHRHLPRPP